MAGSIFPKYLAHDNFKLYHRQKLSMLMTYVTQRKKMQKYFGSVGPLYCITTSAILPVWPRVSRKYTCHQEGHCLQLVKSHIITPILFSVARAHTNTHTHRSIFSRQNNVPPRPRPPIRCRRASLVAPAWSKIGEWMNSRKANERVVQEKSERPSFELVTLPSMHVLFSLPLLRPHTTMEHRRPLPYFPPTASPNLNMDPCLFCPPNRVI